MSFPFPTSRATSSTPSSLPPPHPPCSRQVNKREAPLPLPHSCPTQSLPPRLAPTRCTNVYLPPFSRLPPPQHPPSSRQVHKRTVNPKFDEKFEVKGVLGDFVSNLLLLKVR